MKKSQLIKSKYIAAFVLLFGLVVVLWFINVCVGSVGVGIGDIWRTFTSTNDNHTAQMIILSIRMPRAISALLIGGALSVAGYLLQNFFRNPIAGPFILGISSGAKLIVSLAMVFSLSAGVMLGSIGMISAAFIGAFMAMMVVLLVSRRISAMSILIICGVMIGYICSAVTDFVITFADDSNIVNLHSWSMGSFAGTSWDHVRVMAIIIIPVLVITFLFSKQIHAYQMGDNYAASVGVDVRKLRIALVILSSLLAATVTAFAGPISFVGVAVPHLVKSIFRSSKPIILVPGCFLGGAVFALGCDLIARMAFAPTELNISSVTALFGAPVVIYLMLSRHRERQSYE